MAATVATAHMIRVRATLTTGEPTVVLSGLFGDSAIHTRDRVRAAVVNAGFRWPSQTVALEVSPAPLQAADSGVDLALAVALLIATEQAPTPVLDNTVFLAELGLDGSLRTPRALAERLTVAVRAGFGRAVVSAGSRELAASVPGVTVWAAHHLRELVDLLKVAAGDGTRWPTPGVPVGDLADLPAEHRHGRRVLEIAAAGGHRLALVGSATAGATMLAERLPGLLPDLDEQTGQRVADLYRRAGLVPEPVTVLHRPPWQAPHHTTWIPALLGGSRRPGAVSLAHAGVLFLADAAEFSTRAIEVLCRPLDTGRVQLPDGTRVVEYPAHPQLVLAARPCPCFDTDGRCGCSPARRARYLRRLRPLLDRVAIRTVLPPLPAPRADASPGEATATVAARVAQARATAATRWAGRYPTNAQARQGDLVQPLGRSAARALAPLNAAIDAGGLSYPGGVQVLRLAWTLADLAGRALPDTAHVAEAITLHTGDGI
ncbi:ATP-binding protein [Plantactinospora sp. CA-290183]|uniref:ATP-binding protein n=1 Tax=Plantactinospora sp. CA-290183 TaxID=3240006 RepID=UPI003D906A50